MSLNKDDIETALANTSGSNPNLFVSIHACAPDYLPEDFEKYYDIKDIEGSFSAIVPENTIVITFTPENMSGFSTDDDEQKFMKRLSEPKWVDSRDPIQVRWEPRQHAKLYLPGDKMYNQLTKFEEKSSYFDIFTLDGKKHNTTVKSLRDHGKVSDLKAKTAKVSHSSRRRSVRTNPVSEFAVSAKDQWEFSSIPLQDLINTLKSSRRNNKKNKIRILYIFACNPPTNEDGELEKYTSKKLPLYKILEKIEKLREKYSTEGQQRFAEYFGGSRHTSMIRSIARQGSNSLFLFTDGDEKKVKRTRDTINRGKKKEKKIEKEEEKRKKEEEKKRNAIRYGITKSGNSCFSPCEKSVCGKIFCTKWGTCINEQGEKEKCIEPDFKKSGKKKRTRKNQTTNKKRTRKKQKTKKKKDKKGIKTPKKEPKKEHHKKSTK